MPCRSARNSDASLHPNSVGGGRFSAIETPSPSDMVGPSPVTSNGTETTDIEDDAVEEEPREAPTNTNGQVSRDLDPGCTETLTSHYQKPLNMLTTSLPSHFRNKLEDEPASVIHAPQGYMNFVRPIKTILKGPFS
jgi:hypothetical protein